MAVDAVAAAPGLGPAASLWQQAAAESNGCPARDR
jgi:hypothetical protein